MTPEDAQVLAGAADAPPEMRHAARRVRALDADLARYVRQHHAGDADAIVRASEAAEALDAAEAELVAHAHVLLAERTLLRVRHEGA